MKKLILLSLIVILFTSCQKNYKYVEVIERENGFGGFDILEEKEEILKFKNDSIAYIEAFRKFCISLKVEKEMKENYNFPYSKLIEFKLYNNKGEDITNEIDFPNKVNLENEIRDRIFSMKNYLDGIVDEGKKKEFGIPSDAVKIDSVKINELKKLFRIKKDEFTNDELFWYYPKSAPYYVDVNGLYCYFSTVNGVATNLRFKFQYYDEDWIFFDALKFSIDSVAYDFTPSSTDTDSGNGYVWEWFDEGISKDSELLNALSNAKNAKILIIGNHYHKTKLVTKEQIKSIKNTLELYNALGGE